VSIPILATWPDGSSVGDVRATVTLAPVSTLATASLEEAEPRFVDNSGDPTTIFSVQPCGGDLAVEMRSSPRAARPGENQRFIVTALNAGPGAMAGNMAEVLLPPSLAIRRAPENCVPSATANGWTCNLGGLRIGESAQLVFAGDVATDASGPLNASVQVSSASPDSNPENDSATIVVPLNTQPARSWRTGN
ncbi:MAG: hypothetical protein KDC27_02405, partial [Acidobacteria bacterium]|nr:hypothetical protein [Acidobacteriota bacterium]